VSPFDEALLIPPSQLKLAHHASGCTGGLANV